MKFTIYEDSTITIYTKAIKIINSCKSLSQLQTAKEYCKLFFKQLDPLIKQFQYGSSYCVYYDLQELLIKKEKELS